MHISNCTRSAKLPRGFFIPTPVGDYNPDWAIAFQEGVVRHVYFVAAETKGSLSFMQLRKVEEAKIECALNFFVDLNHEHDETVNYDVMTDYSTSYGQSPEMRRNLYRYRVNCRRSDVYLPVCKRAPAPRGLSASVVRRSSV